MSALPQRDAASPFTDDAYVRQRVDAISGSLLDVVEGDTRLFSGVPEPQRADALEFIEMTGLTRPQRPPVPVATAVPPPSMEDLDPRKPVSFFEQGVADVDQSMEPPERAPLDAVPERPVSPLASRPVDQLRAIIADLSRGDAALPAASEPEVYVEAVPPAREEHDFDALLSSATAPPSLEIRDAAPPTPVPPPPAPLPAGPSASAAKRLAEVEQLLQALEEQPREAPSQAIPAAAAPEQRPRPVMAPPAAPIVLDEGEGDARTSVEYDYAAAPGTRRSRRDSGRGMRRLRRLLLPVAALAAVCMIAVGYHLLVRQMVITPGELLGEAERLAAAGRNAEASAAYARFAAKFPDHPGRPEAQFMAGFTLQLAPAFTKDALRANAERAYSLLERFASENPGHPRAPRAHSLMGLLQFRLENHGEAVRLLREPMRQLEDPEAALPILRTLAAAYVKQGQFDLAESTYLQAAALPKNYGPEQDYQALGYLFRKRADVEADAAVRRDLLVRAREYWNRALEVPGVNPSIRESLRAQLTWAGAELEGYSQPPENLPKVEAASAPTPETVPESPAPPPAEEAAFLAAPSGTDDPGVTP